MTRDPGRLAASIAAGLLLLAGGAAAGELPGCSGLASLARPDTTITAAAVDPADGSCRVAGVIAPAIRFEVWMPPAPGWNGKLMGVGNGGLGGYVNTLGMTVALGRGYATAGTDGGHAGSPFDSSWALGRPDLLADFGHRATHETTVVAKAIVRAYYGAAPARAYFMGCSTGGRQGLIEAERHPGDYEGIVAGAPANPLTGLTVTAAWISQVLHADPGTTLPPDAIALVAAAVLDRCDAADGVVDGLVRDPRRCRIRPRALRCRGGESEGACLTAAQVKALRRLYAGPRAARPRWAYPGMVPGGEVGSGEGAGPLGEPPTGGWVPWLGGEQPGLLHLIQESFFRFVVFEDPSWDWRTFDLRRDATRVRRAFSDVLDAQGDLTAYHARGGRIVMFHGWSDPAVPPLDSIRYRRRVIRALGRRRADEMLRLFMAPGMQHCAGGHGPNDFDPIGTLERWVEAGMAPDTMIAVHRTGGVVDRERPLCAYPRVAVWDGAGDPDVAASFRCGRGRRLDR